MSIPTVVVGGISSQAGLASIRGTLIRCDYCGDALPSVKSRAHIPTTPDLQRLGFAADKIVCPDCAARARTLANLSQYGCQSRIDDETANGSGVV
ncbi:MULTISPECIES: hypothetical protein [unclassified Microbacterium]|uniref:hypothetical protein n=1 Tax=unclassified Microbacterium TaxID=2609290 RepID=UPI003019BFA5